MSDIKFDQKNTVFEPGKTRIKYGGAYTDQSDLDAIWSVLKRNWWTIDKEGKEFEKELSEFTGVKHVALTNSGSSALMVAYAALGLPEGSEVITGAVQFPTAISSLYYNHLVPVFVDVEQNNFSVDPGLVEAAITDKTKAILAVAVAGNIPNIPKLREIADKHNLTLILDNCFVPGTKVFSEGEFKNIEDFNVGDSTTGGKVKKVFKRQYNGEIINIKPKYFSNIKVTPEHPFLIANKIYKSKKIFSNPDWKKANEILKNDYFVVKKQNIENDIYIDFSKYKEKDNSPVPDSILLDDDIAYLLGIYLAEGSTNNSGKICFTLNHDEKDIGDEIIRCAKKVNLNGWKSVKQTATDVILGSNIFNKFVKDFFGTGARNKKIPKFMFNAKKHIFQSFLRGYLDGDGCIKKDSYRICCSSENIVIELQYLLLQKLGIISSYGTRFRDGGVIDGRSIGRYKCFTLEYRTNKKYSLMIENNEYFFIPITKKNSEEYSGFVYNLETENHFYDLPIRTHNCDGFASTYNGKPIEQYFDMAATSFHAAHILNCGEGGAVFTNNDVWGEKALSLREWGRLGGYDNIDSKYDLEGIPSDYPARYLFVHMGFNVKPLEFQCAMGRTQLKKAPLIKKMRQDNFDILFNGLKSLEYDKKVLLPEIHSGCECSWFSFPFLAQRRGELREFLESRNIETRTIFGGNITRQPAFKRFGRTVGNLPVSDSVMSDGMFVSVHPDTTKEMAQYIVDSIKEFYAKS